MKTQKANIDYFNVKNFAKTAENHNRKMGILEEAGVTYDDVFDNDTWSTIETMTHEKYELWKSLDIPRSKRQVATLINMFTREVIGNVLESLDYPRTYDTAFYIMHYMKIREGMAELLGNFEDRGEI